MTLTPEQLEYIRLIAREAAHEAIRAHVGDCIWAKLGTKWVLGLAGLGLTGIGAALGALLKGL